MNKPKLQSHFQYKYTLTEMCLFGTIEIVGTGGVQDTDYFYVDEDTVASGLTVFLVPQVPVQSVDIKAVLSGTNSDSNQDSDTITVDTLTQLNKAIRVDNSGSPATWTDVSDAVLQAGGYGAAGDQVDVIGVPNPATDALWTDLRYVLSNDLTPGASRMAIPDRMEPARTNVRIREDNTFSVSNRFVDNDGSNTIAKMRGRTVCFMIESHEDGGPVVTEYQVLGNAAFNEMPINAPDNGDVSIAASGFYRKWLVYTP